jgi:hypothetical protein
VVTTAWLDNPAARKGGALASVDKETLGAFDVALGRFTAGEVGVHRYRVVGAVGLVLQAKVATQAFEPTVVLVAPSGVRWPVASGGQGADQDDVPSELTLPEAGDYALVVTSHENVVAGRAVTSGEYRLTLFLDAAPSIPVEITGSTPAIPKAAPSTRSGRFGAWESESR